MALGSSCIVLLAGFERHLNNLRDSAAFDPGSKDKPLAVLEDFGGHIAKSVDISAASAELQHFAEQKALFDHEVETFTPCDKRLYKDETITLSQALREQIRERSEWLQNIDRSVRDLLIQHGSILSARENIALQKSMSTQTKIMVALTVVITVLAAVTALDAIKSGNLSWPW